MAGQRTRRRIPEATVARLPVYLRILSEQFEAGVTNISSEELAEFAGLNAAKVRKDLSYLGSYGTRGVGYDVEFLVYQIRRELGLTHDWPVVIVGAGNLGQALAGYNGFGDRGFPVGAIVDVDEAKVGSVVGGVRVRHLDELAQVVQARNISIGVIATPGSAAQSAADALVAAGVTSLLELRAVRHRRAARHQRSQSRSGGRAADPQLLRTASGNGRAGAGTACRARRATAWSNGVGWYANVHPRRRRQPPQWSTVVARTRHDCS